jgi:predicted transposase/invertase (TIGR01784 family)
VATRARRRRKAVPGYDPAYKRFFSHPIIVEELLRGFVPGPWIEKLDFSTLERVSDSFVSEDLRERHSDLIWRLRLKGEEGGWVYLYLLLEFQSTSDPFMAVRLLTYVGLMLEEIIRREKLVPGDRLPAVLPLVLHNGKRRWRSPLRLETLFVPIPRELRRYLPRLTYRLVDERRLDLDRPELSHNRTAALFRIETSASPETLPVLTQAFDDLLSGEESELRRSFRTWLSAIARRTFPDGIIPEGVNLAEAPMLEETLIEWRDKLRREGQKEGRREGRREGRKEALLQQMTLRFGRLPKEVRSQVEQITSPQKLNALTKKILSAKSLRDLGLG